MVRLTARRLRPAAPASDRPLSPAQTTLLRVASRTFRAQCHTRLCRSDWIAAASKAELQPHYCVVCPLPRADRVSLVMRPCVTARHRFSCASISAAQEIRFESKIDLSRCGRHRRLRSRATLSCVQMSTSSTGVPRPSAPGGGNKRTYHTHTQASCGQACTQGRTGIAVTDRRSICVPIGGSDR